MLLRCDLHLIILTETWLKPELDCEVFPGNQRDSHTVIRCHRRAQLEEVWPLWLNKNFNLILFQQKVVCSYQVISCNLFSVR